MEYLMIILFVIPAIVTSITVSPNGNSPHVKMVGGMGVDVENGFVPMTSTVESTTKSNYEKSRKFNNDTKLSLNERYRRLIPYMTFYYANDLAVPKTESNRNVEVEKAQIVEANNLESNHRQPKKIVYSSYRQIPRYQGNRLTQYNINSANPTKIFYRNGVPIHETPSNVSPFKNPLLPNINDYDSRRYIQKQIPKAVAHGSVLSSTRKPYVNLYNDESPGVRYYLQHKEQTPKYKLIPYEQTPPVKVEPQNENVYEVHKPVIVSVLVPKELYVKPRPVRPPFIFENSNNQVRKQPAIISESYYEKQRPPPVTAEPVVESGFKPIVSPQEYIATPPPIYKTTVAEAPVSHYDIENIPQPFVEPVLVSPQAAQKPDYFQYVIDKPQVKATKQTVSNAVNLASLLNSLQVNKSIPKPITRDNVSFSIKTLLQVLNTLKSAQQPAVEPVLSTPKPFVTELPHKNDIVVTRRPVLNNAELQEDYLAEVNPPSQHLDDHPSISILGGTSQQFPLPVTSDDEGGTPGRPGVDYPVLTTIPHTNFDCKTQRYKGFFADTETRCQVWHYCDLNGGQASFLCPNGTIFSQAALTCDWWFNVRCDTTTQLYVLNESLYKYILPHAPKFPEDYSGPLVDKYLTLKFKEMEEEFKKNKNKSTIEKEDEDDEEETKETDEESASGDIDKRQLNDLSVASVIIESPGTSGKVERLIDE